MASLQVLDTQLRDTQALSLSPTRELAVQIFLTILVLEDFINACYGGVNAGEDIKKLDVSQPIVSGSPSRVFG